MCWTNGQAEGPSDVHKIISKGQFTRNVVTLWPFAFCWPLRQTDENEYANEWTPKEWQQLMKKRSCLQILKHEECEFAIKIYSPNLVSRPTNHRKLLPKDCRKHKQIINHRTDSKSWLLNTNVQKTHFGSRSAVTSVQWSEKLFEI